eukprot:gnl/Trimastix_PCT/4548.p1 GENE.gnl/Trimastix_PCT/4548~~gnl/Trimastix_PCT/4548.p1  ORF type:complete len:484 (-),score=56.49 gnl/Trimastix_PCT/4548:23-1441(-)
MESNGSDPSSDSNASFFLSTLGSLFEFGTLDSDVQNECIDRLQTHGCLEFARALNQLRSKSSLSKDAFLILSDIISCSLNECHCHTDFRSAKTIMHMCFTYYRVKKTDEHSYLFQYVCNHPLWLSEDFWTVAFEESVQSTSAKPDAANVFGQLGAFVIFMAQLGRSSHDVHAFLETTAARYELPQEMLAMIRENLNAHLAKAADEADRAKKSAWLSEKKKKWKQDRRARKRMEIPLLSPVRPGYPSHSPMRPSRPRASADPSRTLLQATNPDAPASVLALHPCFSIESMHTFHINFQQATRTTNTPGDSKAHTEGSTQTQTQHTHTQSITPPSPHEVEVQGQGNHTVCDDVHAHTQSNVNVPCVVSSLDVPRVASQESLSSQGSSQELEYELAEHLGDMEMDEETLGKLEHQSNKQSWLLEKKSEWHRRLARRQREHRQLTRAIESSSPQAHAHAHAHSTHTHTQKVLARFS